MSDGTLRVNEVYQSVQGESTWVGCPCVFVRLTGCPLRCRYCDTEYAFREGERRPVADVVADVLALPPRLVELTGGEPLAQAGAHALMTALCDAGRTVLVETSGAVDIASCDPRVVRILDLKTPGSGECARNLASNLDQLRARDEVKFVIVDRADYEWARDMVRTHRLDERCAAVLFSPVFAQPRGLEILGCPALPPHELVAWILDDALPVRLQVQMHKYVWAPTTRGV